MENTHPRDYIIAIRYDGKIFRVNKGTQEPKLFAFQYGDRPCAFRSCYFDFQGHLRPQYWSFPILKNINSIKKAKIEILSTPVLYGNQKDGHLTLKQSILMGLCSAILQCTTIKEVFQWKDKFKYIYGKYFVMLVNDTLTVRDKKNIDKIILDIDLSEMEA